MIVVIQLRGGVLLRVSRPVAAIDEKNVRPAVVVVVDERHARPQRLRQEFLSESAVVLDEANASLLRDVAKRNRRSYGRGPAAFGQQYKSRKRRQQQHRERSLHSSLTVQSRPTPSASAT